MARHAPKSKKQTHGADTSGAQNPPPSPPASRPKKKGAKKSGKGQGGARAKFVPTPDQQTLVAVATAAGYTEEQIAGLINFPHGIDPKTLRKHFRTQIDHGGSLLNLKVASNLYRIAQKQPAAGSTGSEDRAVVTAAIFVAKARMGWRDGSGGITVTPPGGSKPGEITPDGKTVTFTLKLGDQPVE